MIMRKKILYQKITINDFDRINVNTSQMQYLVTLLIVSSIIGILEITIN